MILLEKIILYIKKKEFLQFYFKENILIQILFYKKYKKKCDKFIWERIFEFDFIYKRNDLIILLKTRFIRF